jgi:hypothetical protein
MLSRCGLLSCTHSFFCNPRFRNIHGGSLCEDAMGFFRSMRRCAHSLVVRTGHIRLCFSINKGGRIQSTCWQEQGMSSWLELEQRKLDCIQFNSTLSEEHGCLYVICRFKHGCVSDERLTDPREGRTELLLAENIMRMASSSDGAYV